MRHVQQLIRAWWAPAYVVAFFFAVSLAEGCAKAPPTLTPAGTRAYYANEAVVAIGTLQHAAIELNKVQVCGEPGTRTAATCHPLLSDANTSQVIDVVAVALKSLKTAPENWFTIANGALDQLGKVLDDTGRAKLKGYVEAARIVLNALPRR